MSSTSINKELSTLRKILKLATTKGFAHRVTRFEMATETSRNRVLTADEYAALLKHCPDWLRRAVQFSWETSLSRSDLFHLRWDEIDLSESIIELKDGRAKTGRPGINSDLHARTQGADFGVTSGAAQDPERGQPSADGKRPTARQIKI